MVKVNYLNSQISDINNLKLHYPSYLTMAKQILHKTGIYTGNCLEIAAGDALLSIALARITKLNIFSLEKSEEMLSKAIGNLKSSELEERIRLLKGEFRQIPLGDAVVDLVVSRSSIFFWRGQAKAFQEIYRVLAPGGMAYIGGGFWTEDMKQKIEHQLAERNPQVQRQLAGYVWRQSMESLEAKLIQAKIPSFEINCSDEGLWIKIRRPFRQWEVG